MSKMFGNRAPLSAKEVKTTEISGKNYDEFFANKLQISADLEAELKSKNLAWRFINYNEYRKNNGHRSHWVPYKTTSTSSPEAILGVEADGYIKRGDCILAARPMETHMKHKEFLKKRTDLQSNYQKQKAQELRKDAQEAGIKSTIIEGYEDGDSDND